MTNYYGMLALGPTVKKLAKDGYYGMSEVGKGLVAKGLQYHEMSTALAYRCMECVCVGGWWWWGVRVYYGMARRWVVARVTRARARALEGGVANGCLSDEGAGVARET